MKGVILAGGTGSRLRPFTSVINKHLMPVGRYPMIFYPLAALIEAGIREIIIVAGAGQIDDLIEVVGTGSRWGVNLSYAVQSAPGGNAEALACAEPFVRGSNLAVVQGDNVFRFSLRRAREIFLSSECAAYFFIKQVVDPGRFGVPRFSGSSIVEIIEKPKKPPSSYSVTGIYLYDSSIFELIEKIDRRENGELDLTDVNNLYISQKNIDYEFVEDWWLDAGTMSSYQAANSKTRDIKLEVLKYEV